MDALQLRTLVLLTIGVVPFVGKICLGAPDTEQNRFLLGVVPFVGKICYGIQLLAELDTCLGALIYLPGGEVEPDEGRRRRG